MFRSRAETGANRVEGVADNRVVFRTQKPGAR